MAFMGECWVDKSSGVGTHSHPNVVRLSGVMKVSRIASFVRRDFVDCCQTLEWALRFVFIDNGGVWIGGV